MCGITGIVGRTKRVDRAALERMRDRLTHRGPDDSGSFLSEDGRVALAHRRLAILDPGPAGRQPMSSQDGRVQLVFNGEIYNFKALRRELESKGYAFQSGTDSEVVLNGYHAWEEGIVSRLRGMFAFAVWDQGRRRLFLARDRIGIKPLFYARDDETFTFASEIKAILAGPLQERSLDRSALFDYLTYLYVPTPKTPYRAIRKLPPASTLTVEDGRERIDTYWDVNFDASDTRPEEEIVEDLRSRLKETVRMHQISDVPVGVLLSGGIDSATVTALSGERTRTYAVGFDIAERSETGYARRVAEAFGTEHTESTVGLEEARDGLARMAEWYGEPFYDTSAVPTALVCRAARRHVKVALSGDGGDEVFGGYGRYFKYEALRQRDILPPVVRGWLGPLLARSVPRSSLVRWALEGVERYTLMLGGMTRPEKSAGLPDSVMKAFNGYDDYWHFRRYWRDDLEDGAKLQLLDLKTYLPDDILTKVDRVSMAVSLEIRVPLLDHELVEFAARVPTAVRLRDGRSKHLLRRAMEGVLPAETLERPKRGFSIPAAEWLKHGWIELEDSTAAWRRTHRIAWHLLCQWSRAEAGAEDPGDILREGP